MSNIIRQRMTAELEGEFCIFPYRVEDQSLVEAAQVAAGGLGKVGRLIPATGNRQAAAGQLAESIRR
jgi:hypothetical protein